MDFLNELYNLNSKKITLASRSPRRIGLLKQIGMTFDIQPADVDEQPESYQNEADYACQNAQSKGDWVWERFPADLVISADTIVVKDGKIFEKPRDHADAAHMLKQLSGQTHRVISGFYMRSRDKTILDHEITDVTFLTLSESEIQAYLATGESFDKAGAYGIQGYGALFVEKVDGCYFNVMGFPLAKFYQLLKEISPF